MLLFSLLVLASACAPEGAPVAKTPATKTSLLPAVVITPGVVTTIPQIDDPTGLVLPLDAYRLTEPERAQYLRALAILVNRCLKPFGFTHPVPTADVDTHATVARSRRYGITSAAEATRYGYHLPPAGPAIARPAPGPPTNSDLLLVWTGSRDGIAAHGPAQGGLTYQGRAVPLGGCAGEAARQLGLDPTIGVGEAEVAALDSDIFAQTQQDTRITEVFRAWSACLARAGFVAPNPLLVGSPANPNAPSASPDEIRLAGADIACKHETNLVGVWWAVEVADQQQAVAQLSAPLTTIRAAIDRALAQVPPVVAAGV